MKQIVKYREEKDSLIAEFTDGNFIEVVEYEKPKLNIFESYGQMVYFNQTGKTILIIDNIFRKDKFDTIELKEKENKKRNIFCSNVLMKAGSDLCNYCAINKQCGALKEFKEKNE